MLTYAYAEAEGPEAARVAAMEFAAKNIQLIQRDAAASLDMLKPPHLNLLMLELLKSVAALLE
jgi:hypothetical protein